MPRRREKRSRGPGARRCKDCETEGVTTRRPIKKAGRCATHYRQHVAAQREAAHARHIARTYGITPEQYWQLYAHQGGRCYICRRATGRRRRLAVDHDHSCCPGSTSCGKCVRGLLCKTCNHNIIGHLRDDPEAGLRIHQYLTDPPARAVVSRPES